VFGIEELELLAMGVIQVIANRAVELVPVLFANGLLEVLTEAANKSFDIKLQLCRIVADLMFATDIPLLVGLIHSPIFSAVVEIVSNFQPSHIKTFLHAALVGLGKVASSDYAPGVAADIGCLMAEMAEGLVDVDDMEAVELKKRIQVILHS
jgi:hypothetical protein